MAESEEHRGIVKFVVSRMEGGVCQIENDREIRGDIHPDDVPGAVIEEFGSLFDDLPDDFCMHIMVQIVYHKNKKPPCSA